MPQRSAGLVLGLLITGLFASCDSTTFAPPRPTELGTLREPGASQDAENLSVARPRVVELILSQPPTNDRLYLAQFLRRDTGVQKCAFRVVKPEHDQPLTPAQIAQAIASAAESGTGGVIVEAIDAPEVHEALREAQSKGLAIVLLDSPLTSSSLPRPIPYLTRAGFEAAGKKLVDALIADARLLHLATDGTALVMHSTEKDFDVAPALESITRALKTAGRRFEILSHDEDQTKTIEKITGYIQAHPEATMIFADHEVGLTSAFLARMAQRKEGKSIFVLGGYAALDVRIDLLVKQGSEAIVDRNAEAYARKALQLVLDQMSGKSVPERNELEVQFVHNGPRFIPEETEKTTPAAGKAQPAEAKTPPGNQKPK
jgi:ABC-type sugar transport system substrate-binding protein